MGEGHLLSSLLSLLPYQSSPEEPCLSCGCALVIGKNHTELVREKMTFVAKDADPADERHALLGRRRTTYSDPNDCIDADHTYGMNHDDIADNVNHTSSPDGSVWLAKKRIFGPPKSALRLAVLCLAVSSVCLLRFFRTPTADSSTTSLRSYANVQESVSPTEPKQVTQRFVLDDRAMEMWGAWLEPADEIRTGLVWKESAPALYHAWRETMRLPDERFPHERRQLKEASTEEVSPEAEASTEAETPQPVASPVSTTTRKKKDHRPTSAPVETAPPAASDDIVEKVKGNLKNTWDQVSEGAGNVWNETVKEGKKDEEAAGAWLQSSWQKVSDGAGQVWNGTVNEEKTVMASFHRNGTSDGSIQNATWVKQEKEWAHSLVATLQQLGDRMRSWFSKAGKFSKHESQEVAHWWNNTERSLARDERIVQKKFTSWWNHTSAAEKVWWKDTRRKFRDFAGKAKEKEQLWWAITRDTAKRDWEAVIRGTKTGWNKTTHWERNVVNKTSNFGHKAWNATSNAAAETRDWTVDEEQKVWHAIQHWYNAHATYEEELAMPILYFNSTAAFSLLTNAHGWFDFSQDFFHLQDGWDTQMNQAYCPVASVAAVLNSFPRDSIPLPVDSAFSPHPYATQQSLMTSSCVHQTVIHYNNSYDGVFHAPGGLSLDQTHRLIECFLDAKEFEVQTVHVDPQEITLDEVRRDLRLALADPDARVVVNFNRKVLGQIGSGHFSPVGAYAEREDSFLIMDVAKYKYPPAWVSVAKLYASLATVDKCGDWDFPTAQDMITAEEEQQAYKNRTAYEDLLTTLNCKETYRGYIIVKLKR